MPISNRPHEDGNYANPRRAFRGVTDFRRTRSNGNGNGNGNGASKQRPAPPEVTNAESFYYVKQMSTRTPMVVVMTDGEEIHGWIEWYDRNCIKLNREGAPNLLIQKHCIKYLFKQDEL
jgi:sRNA-binding regulator protein Hfq